MTSPAMEHPDDEGLPIEEEERLALEFECFLKPADAPVCCIDVEVVAKCRWVFDCNTYGVVEIACAKTRLAIALKVREMPVAGIADVRAGKYCAIAYRLCVVCNTINAKCECHLLHSVQC